MNFDLNTNLSELPYGVFCQLAKQLDKELVWTNLFSSHTNDAYSLSADEADKYRRAENAGTHLIRLLGNRGQSVKGFLLRFHELAKLHGPEMDAPQLILHRKFCPVIWSRPEQILVTIIGDYQNHLKLLCKASGFPTPRYQWFEEEKPVDTANSSSLILYRCPCTARNVFRCKVWNRVEDGHEWSEFYRANGKKFQSELMSDVVDLSQFVSSEPNPNCNSCKKSNADSIYRMVQDISVGEANQHEEDHLMDNHMLTTIAEDLIASDKVALIISNRTYSPLMSNLITPHCDAETLAEALQMLKFKTVTLGDLNLHEMRFIIHEYRKLLGEGVYAIFYFVGHGFEANGQCYLLPVGAPASNYGPEHCLSVDWVMTQFRDFSPSLNLILLDICRKYLPCNLDAFTAYSEQFRQNVRINRNTVYGYATSGGVGAYEVKGETNGVFIKYLRKRIHQKLPVIDMLNKVFKDIERDKKVCDVQIPELRSNLTRPRSLLDPLVYHGHTTSYDHHTYHWQKIHELPVPMQIRFLEHKMQVTVWFDYCGHFTNKVYVFSSVGDITTNNEHQREAGSGNEEEESRPSTTHLAYLNFPADLETSPVKVCKDEEEGISICVMLSNLQRCSGEIKCIVELRLEQNRDVVVASKEVTLGFVLITQLSPYPSPEVSA